MTLFKKLLLSLIPILSLVGCQNVTDNVESPYDVVERNVFLENIQSSTPFILIGVFSGSGVVVYKDNNFSYILTDRHVVSIGNVVFSKVVVQTLRRGGAVTWHGPSIEGTVVASSDSSTDLALIRVNSKDHDFELANNITLLKLPSLGTHIYHSANPSNKMGLLSEGIISRYSYYKGFLYIECDSSAGYGSSGGGVFSLDGRFLGIIQSSLQTQSEMERPIQFYRSLSVYSIAKWLSESTKYGFIVKK